MLEKGSTLVDELHRQNTRVVTAKIAYAEVYSGLTRRKREGDLTRSQYALACRRFERDWQAYVRLDLVDEILGRARDLIQRHPLRGFDALHLASALNFQSELGEQVVFAAADERLLRAARAERLRAVNVESAEPKEI